MKVILIEEIRSEQNIRAGVHEELVCECSRAWGNAIVNAMNERIGDQHFRFALVPLTHNLETYY